MNAQGKGFLGIAPIPFLVWMLQEESKQMHVSNVSAAVAASKPLTKKAPSKTKENRTSTIQIPNPVVIPPIQEGILIAGKAISKKAIAGAVVSMIGMGAIGAGAMIHSQQVRQEQIAQAKKEWKQAKQEWRQVEQETWSEERIDASAKETDDDQENASLEDYPYHGPGVGGTCMASPDPGCQAHLDATLHNVYQTFANDMRDHYGSSEAYLEAYANKDPYISSWGTQ